MTNKALATIVLVGIVLVLVGCGAKPASTPEPVAISDQVVLKASGSGGVTILLGVIEPAFEASVPGYSLDVLPGTGSGGGAQGAIEGVLDVALMARPPKDEEAAQGLEFVQFGQAGMAIITHPSVGVVNLTVEQVVAVFSGEVVNWSQVGGPDEDILVFIRDEADSTTRALRQVILGDTPFSASAGMLTSDGEMMATVAATRYGVGLAPWPPASAQGIDVRAVALDGIAPGDSAYPMLLPLGIGYMPDRQAQVQPLIDWLLSERGQAALQEFDVITTR